MSSFDDRGATALLVIDMQRDVVANAHDVDRVTANIDHLVTRARTHDVAVVWIQHEDDDLAAGTPGWRIVDGLAPTAGEPVVAKRFGDSFEATELDSVLSERGVDRVLVTGAQTDACIRSTLHGALARGYDVTLVADAHTTEDMRAWGSPLSPDQAIAYANMYWSFTSAPGRTCATVATTDVDLSPT